MGSKIGEDTTAMERDTEVVAVVKMIIKIQRAKIK